MAILEFDSNEVKALVDHAKGAKEWRTSYQSPGTKPLLWLVGDRGVYLMSNGKSGGENVEPLVAYAKGINPEVDEDWWQVKREVFGGDDGVEDLDWIEQVEARIAAGADAIRISISADRLELL